MQLSLQGLDLQQLQGTFGAVWLQVTKLVALQGALEKLEGTMHYRDLAAQYGELLLKIPMRDGEVSFSSPLQLQDLLADLQSPESRPFTGTASLKALTVPGVSIKLPGITASAGASATMLLFERLPVGDTLLFFKTLTLRHLSAKNDAIEATIAAVNLHDVKVLMGKSAFLFTCSEIQLLQVQANTPTLSLRADAIHITEGVSISSHEVLFGQIESEALVVSATFSAEKTEDAKPGPSLDLRMLDGIEGKLDADIDVKIRVPVIGHRQATHKIRMPIEEGAINFQALRNNLSFLEGSLIDFTVEDNQLVLLLDLPIVADKPLVFWDLDLAGQQLAAKDRALLRTLTAARPATSNNDDEPKKESPLVHVAVDDLDLDIALFSQEAFLLNGIIPKLSLGQLSVKGSLRHLPEQETQPTTLDILAKKIELSLYQLSVGARLLSIRSVEVGALRDGTLVMNGLTPASLRLTAAALKVRGVSL